MFQFPYESLSLDLWEAPIYLFVCVFFIIDLTQRTCKGISTSYAGPHSVWSEAAQSGLLLTVAIATAMIGDGADIFFFLVVMH